MANRDSSSTRLSDKDKITIIGVAMSILIPIILLLRDDDQGFVWIIIITLVFFSVVFFIRKVPAFNRVIKRWMLIPFSIICIIIIWIIYPRKLQKLEESEPTNVIEVQGIGKDLQPKFDSLYSNKGGSILIGEIESYFSSEARVVLGRPNENPVLIGTISDYLVRLNQGIISTPPKIESSDLDKNKKITVLYITYN